METIVEPKDFVEKLWSKQEVKEHVKYRLMRYVLRVDYEDVVLLHNVVSGSLVALNKEEKAVVNAAPIGYNFYIKSLIEEHFMVPDEYDEHYQVRNLRIVLRKLYHIHKEKGITHFTILPTTACNARCYYCFEHGQRIVSMSDQTVIDVIRFISSHCGKGKKIRLSWFGGEPTIAAHRIDQICKGLLDEGIEYQSDITTNGFLLHGDMVKQAVTLWKLKTCNISVDGTEENYNRIKAYQGTTDNPYKRVLNNINQLLQSKVHVYLRMNFDLNNYLDFYHLIEDVNRFIDDKSYFQMGVHPIVGEYNNSDGEILHGSQEWFGSRVAEMQTVLKKEGLSIENHELPHIEYEGCQAYSDSSVTITPDGFLVKCPEQYDENQICGNIIDGFTNFKTVQSWKEYADLSKCKDCSLFPICQRLNKCSTRDICCYYPAHIQKFKEAMIFHYKKYKESNVV